MGSDTLGCLCTSVRWLGVFLLCTVGLFIGSSSLIATEITQEDTCQNLMLFNPIDLTPETFNGQKWKKLIVGWGDDDDGNGSSYAQGYRVEEGRYFDLIYVFPDWNVDFSSASFTISVYGKAASFGADELYCYVMNSTHADFHYQQGYEKALVDTDPVNRVIADPATDSGFGNGFVKNFDDFFGDEGKVTSADLTGNDYIGTYHLSQAPRASILIRFRVGASQIVDMRDVGISWRIQDVQAPSINITYPQTGNTINLGEQTNITWSANDDVGIKYFDVYIDYTGSQTQWELIGDKIEGTATSLAWTPGQASDFAVVKVEATDYAGLSSLDAEGTFTIAGAISTPSLSWTGEANYVSDGLHPETGNTSTTFTWRIQYTDPEGNAPAEFYPKLHILENSSEISGSPFSVNYVSGDYLSGAIYEKSMQLAAGTNYTYKFEAKDVTNSIASGAPTSEVDAPDVSTGGGANTSPSLSWTGKPNYTSDGLNPETGDTTTTFTWRVKYTDADGDPPASGYPLMFIDDDGDGGVGYTMTKESGDFLSGAIYSYSRKMFPDDNWQYRFFARDCNNAVATGAPRAWMDGPSVSEPPPEEHSPKLSTASVHPCVGSTATQFGFSTFYSDADSDVPMENFPKVHILDGGAETSGSPFTMTFVSGGCQTPYCGQYVFGVQLPVGNNYSYYFEAMDSKGNSATGEGTLTHDGPMVVQPGFDDVAVEAGVGDTGNVGGRGDWI